MRIPRLFHPDTINVDEELVLSSEATHHVANVLRLKAGHPVVIFNGDGSEYTATIIVAERRQVIVEIDAKLTLDPQSPLPIHLGQGVSKGDRMDIVLQKATELGVTHITPLITERCAVKLDEKRWEKKQQQWQKIIQGACEQSGRNTLPVLNLPRSLASWLAESTTQTRLVLSPGSQQKLSQLTAIPLALNCSIVFARLRLATSTLVVSQSLKIVIKTPMIRHAIVQSVFTSVSKRSVA